jgi:hypothetical protein
MTTFAEATKHMDATAALNYYRTLYHAEPQNTEHGIVANALNEVLPLIPRVGKWYKEPIPTPENAKNTTMEHYRLVCPFCGRRNGKKREKFCADCGAILR